MASESKNEHGSKNTATGSATSTSGVWQYFSRSEDKSSGKCGLCNTTISCKDSSTSAMKRHLERTHDISMHSAKQFKGNTSKSNSSQPTLEQFVKKKLPASSPKAQRMTEKICKMIYLDLQPFSIVEDIGFKETINEAILKHVMAGDLVQKH